MTTNTNIDNITHLHAQRRADNHSRRTDDSTRREATVAACGWVGCYLDGSMTADEFLECLAGVPTTGTFGEAFWAQMARLNDALA